MRRVAVVLFSLGGPDGPDAVEPFLFNLFNDPAIIGVPDFIRPWLARRIARKRGPVARGIYAELGGGSPLLANTEAQARALEAALAEVGEVRAFVAMRYWHPFAAATAREVAAYAPDRVVLLPLYPHYSTTTSGSSLDDWHRAAAAAGLHAPETVVCCYPLEEGFIAALSELTAAGIEEARRRANAPVRVLFSAHGLPERVVRRGDPYAFQVTMTARAVAARLGLAMEEVDAADSEWEICFQSRVGPLKWIGPYTDAEIVSAAEDGRSAVVVPLAFVSEHSETLVELDIEYRKLAEQHGMPAYVRVPTVSVHPAFVGGLAQLVESALTWERRIISAAGDRFCPAECGRCAQAGQAAA